MPDMPESIAPELDYKEMRKEVKKRSDPPKLSLPKGEVITLVIGEVRKVYSVHKDLLCYHSKYFANLLNGPFSDALERSFDFEDISEHTADLFVQWIYSTEPPSYTCSSADRLKIHHLTLLYIFADQYDFPELCLNTIKLIYLHYRLLDEVFEGLAEFPPHLLEGSVSDSSVDFESRDREPDNWPEDVFEMNEEEGGMTDSEVDGSSEDGASIGLDEHLIFEELISPEGDAYDSQFGIKKGMKGLIDSENHKFLRPICIPLETVALAYEHLQSSCSVIWMFIDFFACDWNPNTVFEEDQIWMETIPAEFFVDIIRCSAGFKALDMAAVKNPLEYYLELEKEKVVERPQKRIRSHSQTAQEQQTPAKRHRRSYSIRSSRTERETPAESTGKSSP